MPTIDLILTKDRSNGRFHKRYAEVQSGYDARDPLRSASRILVDERCNTDQSGSYTIVNEYEVAVSQPEARCRYCFPMDVTDHGDS
jgi:hypothetical protein